MIRYTTGNLLEAPTEALVNTVNEVGVMGKGVALMFRERYPNNTRAYEEASRLGQVRVGEMLVTRDNDLAGPRWIINFPTKKHWRNPSKIEWVQAGLVSLRAAVEERKIRSIALPPLGCGNGGLRWSEVRSEIELVLGNLAGVEVLVYEPTGRYLNSPKTSGVDKLTPARALVAELVRRYSILGTHCTNLEIQKLAWFLQRAIHSLALPNPLSLSFEPDRYGPYADRLRHLLDALDGSYLHCNKRLADAGPFDLIHFEPSRRSTLARFLAEGESSIFLGALENTAEVIDGFESPLGMELLGTVDWLLFRRGATPTVQGLRQAIAEWPAGEASGRRKNELFDDHLLATALGRLLGSKRLAPGPSPAWQPDS